VQSVQDNNQSLENTFSLAHARFENVAPTKPHACVQDAYENLRLEVASPVKDGKGTRFSLIFHRPDQARNNAA
jgi:hypothetical protein